MTQEECNARIATLNDEFRRRGIGGHVAISARIQARGSVFVSTVKSAVEADEPGDPETDPSGRHDFGIVSIDGVRVCWKIDYQAAEDPRLPVDPAQWHGTHRVLSIFTPPEY
ncbi:MAG: hypothetical protein APF80_12335 [Alphaproteobacteria bacterium BRH_c36]|nr:MAG: hypothetical protein APF80_12335 [Alphaproteobacteria bacterium BRH_c36]